MHVERAGRTEPMFIPNVAHQLFAGNDTTSVVYKDPQQIELFDAELQLGVVKPYSSRLVI